MEPAQRDKQRAPRQAEIGEHARETEAVNQTEQKRDQPPAAAHHGPEIVRRGERDRGRDGRFDEARGQRYNPERGERKGNRVGYGERGYHLERVPERRRKM